MSRIFLGLAAIAILILLLAGVTAERSPSPVSQDLGYFHAMAGHASPSLELGDANMQVKGVAARRHATVSDMHRLLQEFTDNDPNVPLADRHVDISGLNQKLDERWPLK
ncbi:hypothetical protein [Magnetospirillum sp. 64-120]|uniref:hypothetical protein n=1 Tax=Magnetospirillum sp. 64-120 TaxID=1895778 RepID=UPI00092945F3|nr:hypothetical protein [Magnetospirillum sp. 64-120]OJX77697.1 MAG: hypothetical protein BGO92_00695 [Magnetospirillum sp. 64-120]